MSSQSTLATRAEQMPGVNLLGRNVNMIKNPDIFESNDIKAGQSVVNLTANGDKPEPIPGLKEKAYVPKNVFIQNTGIASHGAKLEIMTGSEMVNRFKTEATLSAQYSGVSVSGGAEYSYENAAKRDSMYALIATNQFQYGVSLNTGDDRYNNLNPKFLTEASALPDWEENEQVKEKYSIFFDNWGTHVITRLNYGARFSVQIESQNSSAESKEDFKANVEIEYPVVGKGSASVSSGTTSKEYLNKRSSNSKVLGGSRSAQLDLNDKPQDEKRYQTWSQSLENSQALSVINITVDETGDLLRHSADEGHKNLGLKLTKAFKGISKRPSRDGEKIKVHGYLQGDIGRGAKWINPRTWGQNGVGLEKIEFHQLAASTVSEEYSKTGEKLTYISSPYGSDDCGGSEAAGQFLIGVTITGIIGKPIEFGMMAPGGHTPKGLRYCLFPPSQDGEMLIIYPKPTNNGVWGWAAIPSLDSVGVYGQ